MFENKIAEKLFHIDTTVISGNFKPFFRGGLIKNFNFGNKQREVIWICNNHLNLSKLPYGKDLVTEQILNTIKKEKGIAKTYEWIKSTYWRRLTIWKKFLEIIKQK